MKLNKKSCAILTGVLVFLVVMVAVILLLIFLLNKNPEIKVKTTNAGKVVGTTVSLKDGKTNIYEFHNIRYAEAPVGELRFRPPVRNIESPNNTVQATDDAWIMCVQADSGEGTEDCLVLTVRSGDLTASKPVLVWIHGGGLMTGFGTFPGYSFDSEVTHKVDAVTVNINHRLGFLGFSSVKELWDAEAGVYANNGIRDIIAALDWIQDNIAAFGGDPNSVTVIGESGGATAVLALTCSPLANNKFHAAIAQSPAPEMRFSHDDGDKFQRGILEQTGCTQDTLAERKQCLVDLPANKYSAAAGVSVGNGAAYFEFPMSLGEDAEYIGQIMVDPTVVTVSPRNLNSAKFTPSSPLPIIVSNCAEETYSVWLWQYAPPFSSEDQLKAKLQPLFKKLSNDDNLMEEAMALYPDRDPATIWSLMTTDMRSTCPSNDVAEAMSSASNREIYRLYVDHKPSFGFPAVHVYDSIAFFGYYQSAVYAFFGYEDITPNDTDFKFQMHYIEMVKKFALDKKFDDGWTNFPGKSMIYENSDEISNIRSAKPQAPVCEKLTELDLVKYGWQNR